MRAKALFRRLRALFRRKKASKEEPNKESDRRHPQQELNQDLITTAKLQSTAAAQDLSLFFAWLPLEIRRMIYLEVWGSYLKPRRVAPSGAGTGLRLHIYTDSSARTNLTHTRCKLHPGEPAQDDAFATALPFDTHGQNPPTMPPLWYWEAWVMRLNWGKHWKCQHAIQKRWSPQAGKDRPVEKAPFLPLFLTCKRMYLETVPSFFGNVTLIFTSSLDVHHFFLRRPLSTLAHLRFLELSFTNANDHLFLTKLLHDDRPPSTADSNDDGNTFGAAAMVSDGPSSSTATDGTADARACSANGAGASAGAGARGPVISHSCFTVFCKVDIFGAELWKVLLKGIRAAAPNLRDLDVTVGGRIDRSEFLACFGTVEGDEEQQGEGGGGDGAHAGAATSAPTALQAVIPAVFPDAAQAGERPETAADEVWELAGELAVTFTMGERRYVQNGRKMVRWHPELG